MRLLGKVDHPPVREDPDHAGDETLDEEHPPPARQTSPPV